MSAHNESQNGGIPTDWRERLRQLGKEAFQLEEMRRLGFWPPPAEGEKLRQAEAELRRSEIEAEGRLAQTLALGEGETLMPEGAAAADSDDDDIDSDDASPATSLRCAVDGGLLRPNCIALRMISSSLGGGGGRS